MVLTVQTGRREKGQKEGKKGLLKGAPRSSDCRPLNPLNQGGASCGRGEGGIRREREGGGGVWDLKFYCLRQCTWKRG